MGRTSRLACRSLRQLAARVCGFCADVPGFPDRREERFERDSVAGAVSPEVAAASGCTVIAAVSRSWRSASARIAARFSGAAAPPARTPLRLVGLPGLHQRAPERDPGRHIRRVVREPGRQVAIASSSCPARRYSSASAAKEIDAGSPRPGVSARRCVDSSSMDCLLGVTVPDDVPFLPESSVTVRVDDVGRAAARKQCDASDAAARTCRRRSPTRSSGSCGPAPASMPRR